MKSSNIFQKLKSAGVGNPDGVPSAKPKLKLGVHSPAKMAKSPLKKGGSPSKSNEPETKTLSPYEKALSNNPNLNNLIKSRKRLDKSSNAYKKIQNQINKAYGVSKRYELTPENNTPAETPKTPEADAPKIDKVNQAPKVQEAKTNVQEAKTNVKNVKAEVAETNKQARKSKRADKKAARIQKRADRKNARAERIKAEGGTRVGNFLRGKKKEEDAGGESPAAMKKGSAMKMAKKSPMKMAKAGKKDPVKPAPKAGKKDPVKPAPKAGKKSPTKMSHKSPAKKALVGKQENLPEHLKAKIKAAPGKMMKKGSPAKIAPILAAVGKKMLVNAVAKKASSAMKMKGKPSLGKKVKFGKSAVSEKRAARLIKNGKASMTYAIGGIGPDNQPGGKNNKGKLSINKKKSIKIKNIKR